MEGFDERTGDALGTTLPHFLRALAQLEKAVQLANQRPLTELEEQGLIQAFEYTHELAWNVLKDFLEAQGLGPLYGSRDSTREAFRRGLIENGEAWMEMIRSRNLTTHTYNQDIARDIAQRILTGYFAEFCRLRETLGPKTNEA